MRALLLVFLFTASLIARGADGPVANDDMREAIMRYEFSKFPDQFSLYFVQILDSKTEKWSDPSDAFLKRFSRGKIQVSRASDLKILHDQKGIIVDAKTGRRGALFGFENIWNYEDKVLISCSTQWEDSMVSGEVFTLEKLNGKWMVEKSARMIVN